MHEGAETFLKAIELIGKYMIDMKEYQHQNDISKHKLETDINTRVSKNEFTSTLREKNKKLKNKLRNVLENYD